jgi:lipopolysaccharide/colanic/teichoic acid biosynthesis glycosyltransferase
MAGKRFRTLFESQTGAITYSDIEFRVPTRSRPRLATREYALKRAMDFALATVGLIVAAPIWLTITAAIKLEDGGPVFFVQNRWGRHKRPFKVYKFRSMVPDADAKFGAIQAQEHDPRFTRVGRLLRATSLDELPQLLNIWRGQMSWVGPRALPINERQVKDRDDVPDDAIEGFDARCSVRPGLTGVAQIFAPRDVARRHKFRYDRFYIERQSLWLDAKLIVLSCWISMKFRWEARGRKVRGRRRVP